MYRVSQWGMRQVWDLGPFAALLQSIPEQPLLQQPNTKETMEWQLLYLHLAVKGDSGQRYKEIKNPTAMSEEPPEQKPHSLSPKGLVNHLLGSTLYPAPNFIHTFLLQGTSSAFLGVQSKQGTC